MSKSSEIIWDYLEKHWDQVMPYVVVYFAGALSMVILALLINGGF